MDQGFGKNRRRAGRWAWAAVCGAALLWNGCSKNDKSPLASEADGPAEATLPLTDQAPFVSFPLDDPEAALEGTFLDVENFPYGNIYSGGPPKDGIPSLDNPPFVDAASVVYLTEEDLILGVVINGEAKAYPHNIGWWHEIVNDVVGGFPITVTFCPLTGTGLVFDARDEDGSQFELGVSGLIFNNNLIMYDRREPWTLYPQISHKAIQGGLKGERLRLMPVVETTWATWKKLYPDTEVVAHGTYEISKYSRYPYDDYRTSEDFIFPMTTPFRTSANPFASQLQTKERVLGVRLQGDARAYPFSKMGERAIVNDRLGDIDIVVVWDRALDIAVPYGREVNGQTLTFEAAESGGEFVRFRDRETGSLWDIKGLAVEGELAGRRLAQVPAHNSMWFAWVTFWQHTDIWQ